MSSISITGAGTTARAKAPVMVVVQPVIKHEREDGGGRPGPHAGLCSAHVQRLNSWQRARRAGVV